MTNVVSPTASSTMRRLDVGGSEIVVQSAGTGSPVTYLHGMIGTPPSAPLLGAIAEIGAAAELGAAVEFGAGASGGLAVTAPCLPGFSGSAPSEMTRCIHDWVFHLSAIVDALELKGQPLVASSVGAMVALELAAIRPEAFSHLILLAPLGLWVDDDPIADAYATTLGGQRRMLTADPTVTESFFSDPEGLEGDDLIEYGVARYQTRTSAASLAWPIPDHGLSDRIHRITTPSTLIWGEQDAIAPISYLDRWASALPNVLATHTVPNAGHLVDWDQPTAIATLIQESLSGT